MNQIRKFFLLHRKEKLLFFEAFFWIIWARGVLLFFPFRRILPLMKQKKHTVSASSGLEMIRASILRAAAATPWNSTCLMQSMAARQMLKRRRIHSRMSIGMTRDEHGKLLMHAWVECGDTTIVAKNIKFKELYMFE